jgi:hypothetical protein
MISTNPKQYEALFEQFKRLHPEYADEVPYFPRDDVLLAFHKWAQGALKSAIDGGDVREPITRGQSRLHSGVDSPNARDDGVAETLWTVFQAENPEYLDRAAGDLRTKFERERALNWARQKAIEEQEGDELLPVTRRLLKGGVDE